MGKGAPILAFLILFLQSTLGVYTYLKEGVPKCFFEDVPASSLIYIEWKAEDPHDSNKKLDIKIIEDRKIEIFLTISDPFNPSALHQSFKLDDKVNYITTNSGEHEICFATSTSSWINPVEFKLNFRIETGANAIDYEAISRREHLDEISLNVRKIIDRLSNVRVQHDYHRRRESNNRNFSEAVHTKVLYFTLLQILIIALTAFIQSCYLKRYFSQKKNE